MRQIWAPRCPAPAKQASPAFPVHRNASTPGRSCREQLCNISTGSDCVVPPVGATGKFYPFWSLTNKQTLTGVTGHGACLWNFGNDIKGITTHDFGKFKQYGTPDLARFGGTTISKALPNPALPKPS